MSEQNKIQSSFLRKKYLINSGFQIRFIIYTLLIALTVVLSVYLTTNYFFWSFAEKGAGLGLDKDHIFFVFLDQQQSFMNQLLIFLSFFYLSGLTVFGMVLSHRVAGPMYHMHKHMLKVSEGKTTSPLSFRKNDYFQELTESYNAQLEYLKKHEITVEGDNKGADASA